MQILIVEDDELIAELIEKNITMEGYKAQICHNGLDCVELCKKEHYDLILLDVMLPGLDGIHVCRRLNELGSKIPIIMLTAKNDISDKLLGLEAGADDYIVKPFDTRELMARIKTIFRRLKKLEDSTTKDIQAEGGLINIDDLIFINQLSRRVRIESSQLELTHTEYELFLLLCKNPDKVFSRTQLMDLVWGYDFVGDSRTVDIHILRIRKKLGKYSECIDTVFGAGYRFILPRWEMKG